MTRNWKYWPYWVKGGIRGIVFAVIISLALAIFGIVALIKNPFFLVAEYLARLPMYCNDFCKINHLGTILPIFLIETFALGAIIGHLYGKIKNRKLST